MARIFKRKSIRTEILGVVFLSIFFVTGALGYVSFEFSKLRLVSMLGEVMKGIAATTAKVINKEDLALILKNADRIKEINFASNTPVFSRIYRDSINANMNLEELNQVFRDYKRYADLLASIKEVNKIDSPINIYVREGNEFKLALTSDKVILTGAGYSLGTCAAEAIVTRLPQSTGIYKDKDGIWISAYAPILPVLEGGNNFLVEINHKIDFYIEKLNKDLLAIILVCALGFVIAVWVSARLVNKIVSAIEKLDKAVKDIEEEKYDVAIDVKSEDEIGHLSETFEKLRLSIKKKIEELKTALLREKKAHLESLVAITNAIEMRDPYTGRHLYRVEKYALLIAKEMQLPKDKIESLRFGCYLHDIGKIGIRDEIFNKIKLSDAEMEELKKHAEIGARIVEGVEFLKKEVKEIILYHQELYNGKGYPAGLKGEGIPLLARIVSVADAFDAMTTDRPYKPKIGFQEAMSRIKNGAGIEFDPQMCRAFLKYSDSIEDIANRHFKAMKKDHEKV